MPILTCNTVRISLTLFNLFFSFFVHITSSFHHHISLSNEWNSKEFETFFFHHSKYTKLNKRTPHYIKRDKNENTNTRDHKIKISTITSNCWVEDVNQKKKILKELFISLSNVLELNKEFNKFISLLNN